MSFNIGERPKFNHYSDPGHSWVRVPFLFINYFLLKIKKLENKNC